MNQVIVLNADYSYVNTVSWKDAVCLLVKGIAAPIDSFNDKRAMDIIKRVRTVTTEFLVPKVIRLIKYVRALFKREVPYSKRSIFVRDNSVCQYCGKHGDTVDHVIPKARGGKSSFENCVTACAPCNIKKSDKLPGEVGMSLLRRPVQPTIHEFLQLKFKHTGIAEILAEFGLA